MWPEQMSFPRPGPWINKASPQLEEAPSLPMLTCVEARMTIFLLEDALRLRVESEP